MHGKAHHFDCGIFSSYISHDQRVNGRFESEFTMGFYVGKSFGHEDHEGFGMFGWENHKLNGTLCDFRLIYCDLTG